MTSVACHICALENYIAAKFADGRFPDATDPRDFTVIAQAETIEVSLMTDDEPETTWVCTPGSDDDDFLFLNPDDDRDFVRIPLMPEN